MGLLSWLLLGLIAGALARWLMPGPDRLGLLGTLLLGVGGAFLGGWIGSLLGIGAMNQWRPGGLISATLGALLLLWLMRAGKR